MWWGKVSLEKMNSMARVLNGIWKIGDTQWKWRNAKMPLIWNQMSFLPDVTVQTAKKARLNRLFFEEFDEGVNSKIAAMPPSITHSATRASSTIPPYLLLRHVVPPSVVFEPFWGTFQSKFLQPPCISGYQGGSEISFSWFSQKWLEIQLSSKGMIFYPNSQLFKSRIRAL